MSGAFGGETKVWETVGTPRRFLKGANPPLAQNFGFTLTLREGVAPEIAFRALDDI